MEFFHWAKWRDNFLKFNITHIMTRRFDIAHRMVHLRCIINNSIPVFYKRSRLYHAEVSIFREVGIHIISNKKQGGRVVRASRDINVAYFILFL